MHKYLLLFIIICSYVFATAQSKEGIKVTDMLQIKTLGNIAVTDDGSLAAFTVTNIEPDTAKWEYKYVTQIWVTSIASPKPRQLTFAKEGASQPKWSHDGKQLAFVRPVDGKPQIFLLRIDGGEAVQLTKFRYGAGNPEWGSEDKNILFTASVTLKDVLKDTVLNPKKEIPAWPFEKPGFEGNANLKPDTAKADPDGNLESIRAYLANDEKDNKAKVLDRLTFQEEAVTSSTISFTHIFITGTTPGAVPKAITHGFHSFSNAHFANDNTIVMDGDMSEEEHPDRRLEQEIFSVSTNSGNPQQILGGKGMVYNSAAVSPSGKWLAYTYSNAGIVTTPKLAIMPFNGKQENSVEVTMDRGKAALTWSKDGNYLYFTAQSNGGIILCRFNMAAKKVDTLTNTNSGVGSYAVSGNTLLFVKTAVESPFELYTADAAAKNQQCISAFNTVWLQNKQLSPPEKHSFVNDKGMVVEYWVMKPLNYQAGKKYPLLLEVHGGPSSMWGPGESSMWHEFQFFCAKGYGVVYSNPRGSGGYGNDFLRANINDWGDGPAGEVLTALDKTVAEGWADTSKLLITGGSYAGYLVSWIVGHDKRFKAACSQRGVYDLSTFFGEGNAWRLVPEYFGGYPWEKTVKELLDKESPITYVQNITTPYIIFHGETDLRTGVIQGEMLYKSLKVLGRPVEYVRHPGATHEITRSGNNRQRIDQMLRTYEFFERFIH
jgi:dipeptidyl aminopeptidase/acylaminoacyl peptidase